MALDLAGSVPAKSARGALGRMGLRHLLPRTGRALFVVFHRLEEFHPRSDGVPPVESRQPITVAAIAVLPAALLIGIGTIIVHWVRVTSGWLGRHIPRRVAFTGALLIVGTATAAIADGVAVRGLLYAADRFYGTSTGWPAAMPSRPSFGTAAAAFSR